MNTATAPLIPTVLFVDDDELMLATLRLSVAGERLRVITCSDPTAALALVETEPVDVVVSDLEMPRLDGIGLLKGVRERRPEAVRVLLTGRATLEATLRAVNEVEVFRVLVKPFAPEQVRDVVAKGVERVGSTRRTAAAERAAQSRREALARLERNHPGIGTAPEGPVHTIDAARLARLQERLQRSALAALFSGAENAGTPG